MRAAGQAAFKASPSLYMHTSTQAHLFEHACAHYVHIYAQCALHMNVHCIQYIQTYCTCVHIIHAYMHIMHIMHIYADMDKLTDSQVLKDGGSALEAVTEAVTIIVNSDQAT